jgi:DNA mismatch repair ATPase MutS
MAMCEHLVKSNAFVLFATHIQELKLLDSMYSKIVNYHFVSEVQQIDDQIKLIHRHLLKKGPCEVENYGK